MEFFVGLDVSVKTTSVCVMDAGGAIIREGKTESSPEALSAFLSAGDRRYVRVGLEAASRAAFQVGISTERSRCACG
jgi:transposase